MSPDKHAEYIYGENLKIVQGVILEKYRDYKYTPITKELAYQYSLFQVNEILKNATPKQRKHFSEVKKIINQIK